MSEKRNPFLNGDGGQYLAPFVLQMTGILLLVGCAIFWMLTGRESILMMGAATSLITLGAYARAFQALKRRDVEPTPPPPAKE
jgi:hypothetical protein